jgi:hypothetical protein
MSEWNRRLARAAGMVVTFLAVFQAVPSIAAESDAAVNPPAAAMYLGKSIEY